ncbi:MAG: hypothetical protein H6553_04105 [Chitinophagales bacterium]|nr:hypothetical protein [Chitinophagales bacterium]
MRFLKDKNLKEILSLLGLIVLGILILYLLISGGIKRKDMKTNYCYTVAVTDGKKYIPRKGTSVIYHYKVYGEEHTTTELLNDFNKDIQLKGGYYLLKIYTKDPDFNDIDFNTPISNPSILNLYVKGEPICPIE